MIPRLTSLVILGAIYLGLPVVAVQTSGNEVALPLCVQACMEPALSASDCSPADTACICQDAAFNEAMGECMPTKCTIREGLAATNQSATMCGMPSRDRGQMLYSTSVTGGVLALVGIVLRLFSRPNKQGRNVTMLDDWTIIFVGMLTIPFTVFGTQMVKYGYGQDIWTIPFDDITNVLLMLYLHQIFYVFIIAATKVSIVFFYMRVFPIQVMRRFRYILYATMAISICFGVTFVVALAFHCTPAYAAWTGWDEPGGPQCINVNAIGWSNAAIDIAIDAWLLVLPLPLLWQLRLPLLKKLGACLMFAVGLFVTVVSIPRLVSVKEFTDTVNPTYDMVKVSVWASVEAYVGIICACMPRICILLTNLYHKKYPKTKATTTESEFPPSRHALASRLGSTNDSTIMLQSMKSAHDGPESYGSGDDKMKSGSHISMAADSRRDLVATG